MIDTNDKLKITNELRLKFKSRGISLVNHRGKRTSITFSVDNFFEFYKRYSGKYKALTILLTETPQRIMPGLDSVVRGQLSIIKGKIYQTTRKYRKEYLISCGLYYGTNSQDAKTDPINIFKNEAVFEEYNCLLDDFEKEVLEIIQGI